jgi:hypothetical protein
MILKAEYPFVTLKFVGPICLQATQNLSAVLIFRGTTALAAHVFIS